MIDIDPKDVRCDLRAIGHGTYLGVSVLQSYADLYCWEVFLNLCPVRAIIELGVAHGGLGLFLYAQGMRRGASYQGFDVVLPGAEEVPQLIPLLYQADVLSPTGGLEVAERMASVGHPLVLLCDNGNKLLEFYTFAPCLSQGDYIAVHDFGREFRQGARPVVEGVELEPILHGFAEQIGSVTRFWKRLD